MTYCRNLGRLASERPPATAPTPAPTAAPAGPPTAPPVTAPVAAPVAAPDWAFAARGIATKVARTMVLRMLPFIAVLPGMRGSDLLSTTSRLPVVRSRPSIRDRVVFQEQIRG